MTHRPKKSPDEIEKLKVEIESLRQGWQRTQADFDNFRRRTASEQAERTAIDLGRALMTLTPVAENLRRAVAELGRLTTEATAGQWQAWSQGVNSIARQFDHALAAAGLTSIDPPPGKRFNPHEHDALTHQPHADHGADTVVQVVERGYKVGSRVLTPAKVIVSSGAPDTQIRTDVTDASIEAT